MTKQQLIDDGYDDVIFFEDFEDCIVGISHDRRAVYSRNQMVCYMMENDGLTEEEANEYIDYNTIRSLAYINPSPIVLEIEE